MRGVLQPVAAKDTGQPPDKLATAQVHHPLKGRVAVQDGTVDAGDDDSIGCLFHGRAEASLVLSQADSGQRP